MEEEQSKGRRPDQIDFPILWALVRGAQILLVVIYTRQIQLSFGTDTFGVNIFSAVVMLLVIAAFVHGVATGSADNAGIKYQRYFRLKTVVWADVLEIRWVKSRLRVLIKGRGKRRRTLIFLLNPLKTEGAYWAHRLGREVAPPEILERIHALPIETPPTITSGPLYSRWVLPVFIGLVALLMLVMLWRLLSVAGPASR